MISSSMDNYIYGVWDLFEYWRPGIPNILNGFLYFDTVSFATFYFNQDFIWIIFFSFTKHIAVNTMGCDIIFHIRDSAIFQNFNKQCNLEALMLAPKAWKWKRRLSQSINPRCSKRWRH